MIQRHHLLSVCFSLMSVSYAEDKAIPMPSCCATQPEVAEVSTSEATTGTTATTSTATEANTGTAATTATEANTATASEATTATASEAAAVASESALPEVNPKERYRAGATVQILRGGNTDLVESQQEMVPVMFSAEVMASVANDIRESHEAAFRNGLQKDQNLTEFLLANTSVEPVRHSGIVRILFMHPDPEQAATTANLLAEAYINHTIRMRIEVMMMAVEDLRIRVEQQKQKVETLRAELAAMQEVGETSGVAYVSAQDNYAVHLSLYEAMEQRLREQMARMPLGDDGPSIRLVDRATPPAVPYQR